MTVTKGFSRSFAACLLITMLNVGAESARSRAPGDMSEATAPWGRAAYTDIQYRPQKVVFDVASGDIERLEGVIDRASYLSVLTGADPFENSIVLVVHGDAIPVFAIRNFHNNKELMKRAQSLTVGDTIEIKLCGASARLRGFEPADFHGFIKVVPMADTEIVRLQNEEGHAYLQ